MAAELTWKKLPNSSSFQRSIIIPFTNLFLPKKDCGKYLKKHTNFGESYPLNLFTYVRKRVYINYSSDLLSLDSSMCL